MRLAYYTRFAFLFLVAAATAGASPTLTGTFRAPDAQPLVGGPVFLIFEVTNSGAKPVRINYAESSSPCARFGITVDGEHRADGTCDGRTAFSCGSGTTLIAPGAKWSQKIFLNHYYEFPHAGVYHVRATRLVKMYVGGQYDDPQEQQEFAANVDVTLKDATPAELRAAFAPIVADLANDPSFARREAVDVIMTLAPPFLEPTLIKMLQTDDAGLALIALSKMQSARAREAVMHVAEFGTPVDPKADDLTRALQFAQQAAAVRAMGQTRDRSYLPLLLKVARIAPLDSDLKSASLVAVGQAGGNEAVPFLQSELSGPSLGQRFQAALALGETGSRDAVPILIDLLSSQDADLRNVASVSLRRLNHRHWGSDADDLDGVQPDPAVLAAAWKAWWKLNSASATIYSPGECSEELNLQ